MEDVSKDSVIRKMENVYVTMDGQVFIVIGEFLMFQEQKLINNNNPNH